MKKIILGLGILLLAGCTPDNPIKIEKDHGIKSYLIGIVDGCNLWQVDNGGSYWIYFVKCPNANTTTNWVTGSKSKVHHSVSTENQ